MNITAINYAENYVKHKCKKKVEVVVENLIPAGIELKWVPLDCHIRGQCSCYLVVTSQAEA